MIATRTATATWCAALLLAATACGSSPSGPTSDTAGKHLSRDARSLLADIQRLLKAPRPYTVSKDSASAADASSCGKGKEKRLFAGAMRVPAAPDVHSAVVLDGGDANGYLVQRGYSEDADASKPRSYMEETEAMVDKKGRARLDVVLTSIPGSKLLDYTVTGTTDCLHVSS